MDLTCVGLCVSKFEVSTHYEDIKGDTKYRKWVGLGYGSLEVAKLAALDRAHISFY